jgi:hypothetical protein
MAVVDGMQYVRSMSSPEWRPLRAGPLTMELDGIDLRTVRFGDVELVRRVYVAIRDGDWNTIRPVLGPIELEHDEERFGVRFDARHTSDGIDFAWRGSIVGDADGHIVYRMDGQALAPTHYARIGICVHHPLRESVGRPYTARTPHGPVTGILPALIAPQRFEDGVYLPALPSFDRLEIALERGGRLRFDFEGDLWETEDHRNWTDANFKTYSTPMALGYPHELAAGAPLVQSVSISVSGGLPEPSGVPDGVELTVGEPVGSEFPAVGLAMAREGSLGEHEAALLRELGPAHLRADVILDEPAWREELERAQLACRQVGCALELALHLRPEQQSELAQLAEILGAAPRIARVLVVLAHGEMSTPEETTPAELVELVRGALGAAIPGVPFAGGTDLHFCELNRTRPRVAAMDGVFYPVMPQVHAFEDVDLMENLEAQADTAVSARALAEGKAVFVGPVTLKERFPYLRASGREAPSVGDELPASVDVRQAGPLGAAWTAGSLAALAGADAVTYYETVGRRGVIADGRPMGPYAAAAGTPFPLFGVLATATRWQGLEVLRCKASVPRRALGVAVRAAGEEIALLVASLVPEPQAIAVRPPAGGARTLALGPYETRVETFVAV